MKRVLSGLIITWLMAGTVVHAQGRGSQKVAADANHLSASVQLASAQITFSTHEAQLIRNYYAPQYRNLPPGLQKKLARTGQLPPGWQKKFDPFPAVVERQLVSLPAGYRRGVLDGHAVIFDDRTHVILDVAALF